MMQVDEKSYQRLITKVVFEPSCGCWIWTGSGSPSYGIIKIGGRNVSVHVASYVYNKSPIPSGMELDHVCRLRCCVNPDHMRVVTRAQNLEAARPYRARKYKRRNNAECPGLILALASAGSKKAIAAPLGISSEAVSNWKRVPAERVLDVERVTGVPRHIIRPDIYPPPDKDMAQGAEASAA